MGHLRVRLTPRSSQNAIGAFDADGVLHVRVTPPALEGKANAALVRVLAKALGVAPSRVLIARGATARTKTVDVDGMTAEEIRSALT